MDRLGNWMRAKRHVVDRLGNWILALFVLFMIFGILDHLRKATIRNARNEVCEAIRWSHPICYSKIE